jgi:hypothetical protein
MQLVLGVFLNFFIPFMLAIFNSYACIPKARFFHFQAKFSLFTLATDLMTISRVSHSQCAGWTVRGQGSVCCEPRVCVRARMRRAVAHSGRRSRRPRHFATGCRRRHLACVLPHRTTVARSAPLAFAQQRGEYSKHTPPKPGLLEVVRDRKCLFMLGCIMTLLCHFNI